MNTRTAARLTLAAALVGTTVAGLAAPAGAAAPTRIDAEYWGVSCVGSLGDGRTLFLFGSGATDGSEGGVGAFVEDGDGRTVAEGEATAYAFGDTFSADVPLGEEVLAVTASVSAGAPITETLDERDGNRWTRGSTTRTELSLVPTQVSLGGRGITLADDACSGELNAFDVRSTNPAATVLSDRNALYSEICTVTGIADAEVRVGGVLPEAYVEVVLDHGGEGVEKAQGPVVLRAGRGQAQVEVIDLFSGDVTTTANITVELVRAGRSVRDSETFDQVTESRWVTPYRELVAVDLADGRHGTADCAGFVVRSQVRIRPQA